MKRETLVVVLLLAGALFWWLGESTKRSLVVLFLVAGFLFAWLPGWWHDQIKRGEAYERGVRARHYREGRRRGR